MCDCLPTLVEEGANLWKIGVFLALIGWIINWEILIEKKRERNERIAPCSLGKFPSAEEGRKRYTQAVFKFKVKSWESIKTFKFEKPDREKWIQILDRHNSLLFRSTESEMLNSGKICSWEVLTNISTRTTIQKQALTTHFSWRIIFSKLAKTGCWIRENNPKIPTLMSYSHDDLQCFKVILISKYFILRWLRNWL